MHPEVGNLLGSISKDIYNDTVKPGAIKVGQALETIIDIGNTLLTPVKLINEKSKLILAKNIEKYQKKIEAIETEDLISVPIELSVPIIERLTYIENEYLSEMFVNLLTSASSSKTIGKAHPSFVHAISSISSDEAKILKYLHEQNKNYIPFVYFTVSSKNMVTGELISERYYSNIPYVVELTFPDNIDLYLSNLVGLGIISQNDKYSITQEEGTYLQLQENLKYQSEAFRAEMMQEFKGYEMNPVGFNWGHFKVTDFGIRFIDTCVNKNI